MDHATEPCGYFLGSNAVRTITITIGDGGGPFDVIEGDRSTGELNFDEMLGTLAHIALRGQSRYPMYTAKEHEFQRHRHHFDIPRDGHQVCSKCFLSDTYARHFVVPCSGS